MTEITPSEFAALLLSLLGIAGLLVIATSLVVDEVEDRALHRWLDWLDEEDEGGVTTEDRT